MSLEDGKSIKITDKNFVPFDVIEIKTANDSEQARNHIFSNYAEKSLSIDEIITKQLEKSSDSKNFAVI